MSTLNHLNAAIRVCVDQVDGGRIMGQVFSQRLTGPIAFSDIGNLLLQLEHVLNEQNFPQAFQRARTFASVANSDLPIAATLEEGMSSEQVDGAKGKMSTFDISVLTRRNTTWQGIVDWLDGSEPEQFSSVLDLIKCTDQHIFAQI